jgi:radical SAM protein with 4Fe4S-binding SPASM domain
MNNLYTSNVSIPEFFLWERLDKKRALQYFELELTARCNNNCRHCYINLPEKDIKAIKKELSLEDLKPIIDEAVSLGALWCCITGGEPLLREDFFDIYLYLKRKGLLVSVFTNATLITEEHIRLFRKYPPRDVEVTVYGITEKTYNSVTRGSFDAFMKGLNLLLENDIKIRLKAMAIRSNAEELPMIASFCREKTKDYFRFDPVLHLRYDRNKKRNNEIIAERLTPEEIIKIEKNDAERLNALEKICDKFILPEPIDNNSNYVFLCSAGNISFTLGYDGYFRLCSSLTREDCVYDLNSGNLTDAWNNFVPSIRSIKSESEEFLRKCRICSIFELCRWCPAHADLETGEMDRPVDYFCEVAGKRAEAFRAEQLNEKIVLP